jgi:hypothetical protein
MRRSNREDRLGGASAAVAAGASRGLIGRRNLPARSISPTRRTKYPHGRVFWTRATPAAEHPVRRKGELLEELVKI